jgi:hypothetical protein
MPELITENNRPARLDWTTKPPVSLSRNLHLAHLQLLIGDVDEREI